MGTIKKMIFCLFLLATFNVYNVAVAIDLPDVDISTIEDAISGISNAAGFLNLKEEYFLSESAVISSCGEVKDGLNGYVYSHQSYMLGPLAGDYNEGEHCNVTISVGDLLGQDFRVMLQFPDGYDLAPDAGGDCGDFLTIYDGASADDAQLAQLCGTNETVAAIESSGPDVTLLFHSNSDGLVESGIMVFFSVYRIAATCSSEEFQCDTNRCIPSQFTCDSVTHCIDETDEDAEVADCGSLDKILGTFFGIGLYGFIGIVAGIVVVIIILIIICCCCCCCKKKDKVRTINIQPSA